MAASATEERSRYLPRVTHLLDMETLFWFLGRKMKQIYKKKLMRKYVKLGKQVDLSTKSDLPVIKQRRPRVVTSLITSIARTSEVFSSYPPLPPSAPHFLLVHLLHHAE